MSSDLLASKIVVQEEPPSLQNIPSIATAVGLCVGITEKGPIGTRVSVTGYPEWRRVFGKEVPGGIAASAITGFFQNGGLRLYFTRTVHYDDIAVAASKTSAKASLRLKTAVNVPSAATVLGSVVGPFALNDGDALEIAVDGESPVTATVNAIAAGQSAANAAPYALNNNDTLLVKIDGGAVQTITFLASEFSAVGAATAEEVAAVIASKLAGAAADVFGGHPQIHSDTLGTSSHVEVTGGTANGALGFPTGVADGGGNVADIGGVTIDELRPIISAAGCSVSNEGGRIRISSSTTGDASSVQVLASSGADDELGLDNSMHYGASGTAQETLQIDGKYDGSYANDVTVLITNATSGIPSEFNLRVLVDGVILESFANLSMSATAERFAEAIVNAGSRYVEILSLLEVDDDAAVKRPANSPGASPVAFGPLTGGDDGLAGLTDNDFVGDPTEKTGIRSFDQVDDGTLLFIPDRPTPAVHNAMVAYCEVIRGMSIFPILDPPAGLSYEGINAYVSSTASLVNLSEFGAIYWPQIRIVNPNVEVYGAADTVVIPPSGHIAGMFSRVDSARVGGVYDPPGGVASGRLFGVVGLEDDSVLEETVRDILAPHRINPITRHRGQPIAVDGVDTLRGTGNYPTVGERRGVIFIEQSLKDGLQFARLRNNDARLRAEVNRTIRSFLRAQMKVGAFASQSEDSAFFVDVSEALNPPSEIFAGKLNVRVGLATQKPAKFIILSFSQDTRAFDEELAAAAS